MADPAPYILYVPGLMPKPPATTHQRALAASLAAGLAAAEQPRTAATEGFDLYAWTQRFYGEDRDYALDAESVAALLAAPVAGDAEIREAVTRSRRFQKALFRIGNALPFLIPHFATDRQRLHVRDLNRYANDRDGSATAIRDGLKARLRAARGRPLLLIGHSMGSVICWDTLWEAAFHERDPVDVSLFLTMGSPLGQRYVQQRLLSHRRSQPRSFPGHIRRWVNLAAMGDMTSLDQRLAREFACRFPEAAIEIEDYEIANAFRLDGEINPHAEYGYLANPVTARLVAEWWQEATTGDQPDAARPSP